MTALFIGANYRYYTQILSTFYLHILLTQKRQKNKEWQEKEVLEVEITEGVHLTKQLKKWLPSLKREEYFRLVLTGLDGGLKMNE